MLELLWLLPVLPFAGFVVLAACGRRLSRHAAAAVGVISVGLSMLLALFVAVDFIWFEQMAAYQQQLWSWIPVSNLASSMGFYLDALSCVMVLVVTVVSFLIHLYSAGFMIRSEGYSRFFAYMNLFVGSMLTLVMADNLLLLYLGWEGVGLCSYLLIGFWYADPANGRAAVKAFVVTRVGDAAMAVGLFLLFFQLGTFQIQEIMQRAQTSWPAGSALAIGAAALLLAGALGKSAQLPLQTWLPDAMAGPTPVSALIHAATMVTAGVYLVARTHVLFALAPPVLAAVAIIGAITLLVSATAALTQSDIKRVLAYSTISQIGYMFLALGVGAWSAAIFHFTTHACFKALLFLGAGVVIQGLDEEHNMFKMGGLRRIIPGTMWVFLIGAASLSALPLVTAGFYSKDLILIKAWSSVNGSFWLWAAGALGSFLTALYAFRMVFLTFFGEQKSKFGRRPGITMKTPLVILAVLSILTGFLEIPRNLGNVTLFSGFTASALPPVMTIPLAGLTGIIVEIDIPLLSLMGLFCAYLFYLRRPALIEQTSENRVGSVLHRLFFSGWGFDWFYDRLLVWPFLRIAHLNRNDVFDLISSGIAVLSRLFSMTLVVTQTGKIRWYAAGIAIGAVILIGLVVIR